MLGLVVGAFLVGPTRCYIAELRPFGGCETSGCRLRIGIIVPEGSIWPILVALIVGPTVLGFLGWLIGRAVEVEGR
jgi:hypothetical protein